MNIPAMKSLTAPAAIVLVLASCGVAVADVRASLSQGQVALGESFTLGLEVTGQSTGALPDLSPLQGDFEIEGTSQSSTTNVVNGAVRQSHGWTIRLSPKATGQFTVPAITIGRESSDPLAIDVVDPSTLPQVTLSKDGVQVEMTAPDRTYYVQQEIPVTVRVLASETLRSASLSEPSSPDFTVRQTGDDKSYTQTISGRPVVVTERTYMLTPQKSGDLLIPPVTLRGFVDDPNLGRSMLGGSDPFDTLRNQFGLSGLGGSIFDRFMNQGREVVARSTPISLIVDARPNSQAGWFLPAKKVNLKSKWEADQPSFKVGEAATKVVQLIALGASKEQLPDLNFGDVDGARIYVDRVDDHSVDTDQGTATIKQYTLSVVPTRSGAVTLPALQVQWLDADNGEQKVATLAAETIEVMGAAGGSVAPASAKASSEANTATTEPHLTMPLPGLGGSDARLIAVYGALALAIVGFGSIAIWRRLRSKARRSGTVEVTKPQTNEPVQTQASQSRSTAASAVRAACKRNDAPGAFSGLRTWFAANGLIPQAMSTCGDSGLRTAIHDLEVHLYKETKRNSWDGRALLRAFDNFAERTDGRSGRSSATGNLPPLYSSQPKPAVL